jgi:hypothetical protein
MEVLIRCAAAALLFSAGACEFVRSPTVITPPANSLVVHSILSAESDTVRVLLTRPPVRNVFTATPVPVSGARVRIAGGGAQVVLQEAPPGFPGCLGSYGSLGDPAPPAAAGPGCYAATLPGGVAPGATYTLEVDPPGGERVSGQTTVPAVPEWVRPTDAERIRMRWTQFMAEASAVALRWRSSAAALEIPVVATDRVFAEGRVADVRCTLYLLHPDGRLTGSGGMLITRTDSLHARAHLTSCTGPGIPPGAEPSFRADSASVSLLLAAYDSAYATHVERQGGRGIREVHASQGLTGAYGVFGSVATARRRVVLIAEQ